MAKRPLLSYGELMLIGASTPTCLSFHPGPDPKKDPLGWRPLCGRRPPSSIQPDRDQVTCKACLSIMGATIYEEPV